MIPLLERFYPVQLALQEQPEEWGDALFTADGLGMPQILTRCHRYTVSEKEIVVYDKAGNVLQAFHPGIAWMFMARPSYHTETKEETLRFHAASVADSKKLAHELYPEESRFMDEAERGARRKSLRELGVEQDKTLEKVLERQYL